MIHFVCVEWLSLGSMWPARRPWLADYKKSYQRRVTHWFVSGTLTMKYGRRGTLCRF